MARAYPGASPGVFDDAAALFRRAGRRLRERRCRLSARPRVLGDQRAIVTMLEGPDVLVDLEDRGLSQDLLEHGYWEMWLTEALEAALRPGMVAVDIGANLGYFSMLMAARVGVTGHVHACEPNPVMAKLLSESAALNGFGRLLTLHTDPLWNVDGESSVLCIPEGEPKNGNLVTNAGYDIAGPRLVTRRFDSNAALLYADVIKIDVEGAEERIWRGMSGLFARQRPLTIFLEYTPVRYADPSAFLDEIEAEGFALRELSVSHGIRHVTRAEILAGDPAEDRMLALERR